MKIFQATIADLETLLPLFDAYRQFYGQSSDFPRARQFLSDRFEHQQSVIFIAHEGEQAVGFTQIFPSFSSTRMSRTLILNDLFVAPDARGSNIGKALLTAAREYGQQIGAAGLALSTALENTSARALYEKVGWTLDEEFCVYRLPLSDVRLQPQTTI